MFASLADVSVVSTHDVSSLLSGGSLVWIDGVEYTVDGTPTSSGFSLSVVFAGDDGVYTGGRSNNGFEWNILFLVVRDDLNSFQALPGSDWRGTGVTLRVRRPRCSHSHSPVSSLVASSRVL